MGRPIDIIAAAVIALLSGMGVGSAGLLVVWLTATGAATQSAAQGLNLCFFIFSSAASLIIHLRKRRILPAAILFMVCFGTLGSIVGSRLSTLLDQQILRRMFGAMLTVCGGTSLIGSIGGVVSQKNAKKLKKTG